MDAPLLSVITVALNVRKDLSRTIESVRMQQGVNYEHIIIDGGSTDGSVEWLRQFPDGPIRWVSEPDTGIYDAMNKGIDRATGHWLFFLGAGDILLPDVLERVTPYLTDSLDVLIGNIRQTDGHLFTGTFSDDMLVSNTVHHQGAFYHRRVFAQFRYRTSLRALSDYELNLLLYLQKKRFRIVDVDVSECDMEGISSGLLLSLRESNYIKFKHLNFWKASRYSALLGWKYLLIYLRRLKKAYESS